MRREKGGGEGGESRGEVGISLFVHEPFG